MKAIILAGGEGTRLRPLTGRMPKPMVRLLDRPVAEHILLLLKSQGFTEIGMSLMYLPYAVSDYFGDGSDFGVSMRYHIEQKPLGTAGGVLEFEDFYGDEDFLVISGDAVCDLDLSEAVRFHRERRADATIVLYRHENPLEYGLVLTHEDGAIERFIEKPSWGQVFSDQVNTGIYILSPRAMALQKRGRAADFARDVFPALLSSGARLFGCVLDGYWCDMGDSAAYLKCCFDALSGKLKLDMPVKPLREGIYSQRDFGGATDLVAPCYISSEAVIEPGAKIGPYSVVQAGAVIGPGSSIEYTVCSGTVGSRCAITGAVIDTGVVLGNGCVVGAGAVIGAEAHIGADVLIHEGVRIWPAVEIERGAQVRGAVSADVRRRGPAFEEGILCCETTGLTSDLCSRIGSAVASAMKSTRTGVGSACGSGAVSHASAVAAGVTAAGGDALMHDAKSAAQAAALCRLLALDFSVFVECGGDNGTVYLFDKNGLSPGRDALRKLELALNRGSVSVSDANTGSLITVAGTDEIYGASLRMYDLSGVRFAAGGTDESRRLLEHALKIGGGIPDNSPGVPVFTPSGCGRMLELTDERGVRYDRDHTLALTALAFCRQNPGAVLSAAYTAPSVFDDIAVENGAVLLRYGRDGDEAMRTYADQLFMRDAVFTAALLCDYTKKTGEKLADLAVGLPRFTIRTREVACVGDRGQLMRRLSEQCADMRRELYEGLRVCLDGGWVHISPAASGRALRITGEGMTEEYAEELCADFSRRVTDCDSKNSARNVQ